MKAVFCALILFSFALGVFLAPYFSLSNGGVLALFGIFFLLSITLIPEKWLWLSMIVIGFLFLGIFRFQQVETRLQDVSYPKDREDAVKGFVVQPPEDTKKATKVVVEDSAKKTKIILIVRPFSGIKYGDYLEVRGNTVRPDTESLKNSLFAKGISVQMLFPEVKKVENSKNLTLTMRAKGFLYRVRNRFEDSINNTLPEPESSFMAGLLLGSKRNLPDWLMDDLQKTGTTHIIALSGFNITIIVMALRFIFSKKSAKLSFYMPLLAIGAFVVMTGAQSSVVRAGIMGAMMMLAYRVGRQSSATMAIVITAAAMILYNPMILRYDIGFQLSFAAFLGIIYLAPIIKNLIRLKSDWLREMVSMTLSAQIMTFPILLYYFGNFSAISLATNLIVLPFIPVAMFFGFVSTVFGMVSPYFGKIFSWTILFSLKAIIAIIHLTANLSFSSFKEISFSSLSLFFTYVVIVEVIFIYKSLKRRRVLNAEK